MNKIPKGLLRCEICGEYNGKTKKKCLNWGTPISEKEGEKYISVLCICNGIPCPRCKKNKIHRPLSNSYSETDNSIAHSFWLSGQMPCGECRKIKI